MFTDLPIQARRIIGATMLMSAFWLVKDEPLAAKMAVLSCVMVSYLITRYFNR